MLIIARVETLSSLRIQCGLHYAERRVPLRRSMNLKKSVNEQKKTLTIDDQESVRLTHRSFEPRLIGRLEEEFRVGNGDETRGVRGPIDAVHDHGCVGGDLSAEYNQSIKKFI